MRTAKVTKEDNDNFESHDSPQYLSTGVKISTAQFGYMMDGCEGSAEVGCPDDVPYDSKGVKK